VQCWRQRRSPLVLVKKHNASRLKGHCFASPGRGLSTCCQSSHFKCMTACLLPKAPQKSIQLHACTHKSRHCQHVSFCVWQANAWARRWHMCTCLYVCAEYFGEGVCVCMCVLCEFAICVPSCLPQSNALPFHAHLRVNTCTHSLTCKLTSATAGGPQAHGRRQQ